MILSSVCLKIPSKRLLAVLRQYKCLKLLIALCFRCVFLAIVAILRLQLLVAKDYGIWDIAEGLITIKVHRWGTRLSSAYSCRMLDCIYNKTYLCFS